MRDEGGRIKDQRANLTFREFPKVVIGVDRGLGNSGQGFLVLDDYRRIGCLNYQRVLEIDQRGLWGLDLISRQSSLSCETKLLARLWKDLVFTAAGTSVDLGDPFSQGGDLRANLLRILSQRTSAITSTSTGSFFSFTTLRAR